MRTRPEINGMGETVELLDYASLFLIRARPVDIECERDQLMYFDVTAVFH